MTTPTRLQVLVIGTVVLIAACQDATPPTTPNRQHAVRGSAAGPRAAVYDTVTLGQWFQQASPAVLALDGGVYADLNEEADRLEFGVLDAATRDAARARLAGLGIPSDAILVQIVGPP